MKNSPDPHLILLVDDNRDGLLIRRALLEEQGFHVAIAHNGEEGLKAFQESTFSLVVTDYRMPAMNGVELIRKLRELQPRLPIVLLSGAVGPLGLTEENTGADAVIAKTANEATHLIRSVKRLMASSHTRRRPPTRQGGGTFNRARATAS